MCWGWQVVDPGGQGWKGMLRPDFEPLQVAPSLSSGCPIPSLHLCPLSARSLGSTKAIGLSSRPSWPKRSRPGGVCTGAAAAGAWGTGHTEGRWAIVSLHLGYDDEEGMGVKTLEETKDRGTSGQKKLWI